LSQTVRDKSIRTRCWRREATTYFRKSATENAQTAAPRGAEPERGALGVRFAHRRDPWESSDYRVGSGKGVLEKSTVSTNLAVHWSSQGQRSVTLMRIYTVERKLYVWCKRPVEVTENRALRPKSAVAFP